MSARVGIDLGGTKIQGVLMDSDGQVLKSRRIATPRDDYDGTLKAIGALVKSLDASERATVGIGTPGSWRRDLGAMQNCNSTWLNGRPLLPDLEVLLGPRVRMANDADCFALSESRAGGSAAGVSVVFGAILGTGVGGGIVVDGRLLQGVNSLTGEWGHTPLPNFGEQADEAALGFRGCYCGRLLVGAGGRTLH